MDYKDSWTTPNWTTYDVWTTAVWTTNHLDYPPIGLPMTFGLPLFGLHPKQTTPNWTTYDVWTTAVWTTNHLDYPPNWTTYDVWTTAVWTTPQIDYTVIGTTSVQTTKYLIKKFVLKQSKQKYFISHVMDNLNAIVQP